MYFFKKIENAAKNHGYYRSFDFKIQIQHAVEAWEMGMVGHMYIALHLTSRNPRD